MVKLLSLADINALIKKVGILQFYNQLIDRLNGDYVRWDEFHKSPRHAIHYPHGVMELMPIGDDDFYAYKFVNGHPNNPKDNKLTVAALGMLAEVPNGYPLMLTEMTLLTAFRTAATSALVSQYMCRKNCDTMGIIGTGAQGEFQVLAHHARLGCKTIKYFDIDSAAMEKFAKNLADFNLDLIPCHSAKEAVTGVDLITTATADKKSTQILSADWIKPGMHINGIGGDCPGKTELDLELVTNNKIVVEYLPQTEIEGEIQHLDEQHIYAELWELASGEKAGRENDEEITIFDSVGFALEDYSILRLVYDLAQEHNLGSMQDLIPELDDPKDLYSLLK